jgi:hypothetical protein
MLLRSAMPAVVTTKLGQGRVELGLTETQSKMAHRVVIIWPTAATPNPSTAGMGQLP